MSAFNVITISDGQATPVAHNFSPASLSGDATQTSALYEDRVGGIAIGFPQIWIVVRRPVPSQARSASVPERMFKVVAKVKLPIMESTSAATGTGIPPAPTVAYMLSATTEFLLPERSTLANRNDLVAYCVNMLNNTVVQTAVKQLEGVY